MGSVMGFLPAHRRLTDLGKRDVGEAARAHCLRFFAQAQAVHEVVSKVNAN